MIQQRLMETSKDKQTAQIRLSQQSWGFAAILGASGRKTHTASAAARPHCPECSLLPLLLPLSSFSLCCISAGPHRSTAPTPFSSPSGVCFPRLPCFPHTPPARPLNSPSLPPVCLPSSPVLQTVQCLIYILLVEARHVRVHVPVVVADVALCTPVGHRSEAERWREFVGLLEL